MSSTPNPQSMEPDGGNLYRPHPLMVNSGQFWRCAHGQTGYQSAMEWIGCGLCAEADPEALRLWMRPNQACEIALADCLREIEHALNYWYPLKGEASPEEMDARHVRLFRFRDRLRSQIHPNVLGCCPHH